MFDEQSGYEFVETGSDTLERWEDNYDVSHIEGDEYIVGHLLQSDDELVYIQPFGNDDTGTLFQYERIEESDIPGAFRGAADRVSAEDHPMYDAEEPSGQDTDIHVPDQSWQTTWNAARSGLER